MKKPEIEVVRFGAEDVIATSGKLLTWSGVGGTGNDSIVSFGDKTYDSKANPSEVLTALGAYYEWSGTSPKDYNVYNVYFSTDSGNSHAMFVELMADIPEMGISEDYNATYTFKKLDSDKGLYWFYKQP